jgi:type IV secretory pathway VirB10-like protein
MTPTAPISEPEITDELRLRPSRPPVTRLSRKVLIGLGATASLAVIAAVAYAMRAHPGHAPAPELFATGGPAPERLASLPKDYSAVPKLGPPLPGDLGRPIVEADAGAPTPMGPQPAAPDPVAQAAEARRQRDLQAREAARASRLFAGDTAAATRPVGAKISDPPTADGAAIPGGAQASVLEGPVDRRTASPDRLASPPSPYVVQAGAVIPAALVTGIRSDLPGQILGQVTENVFDTVTGRFLLIPQGARLIGTYDNQVVFGQSRVLLIWTRLILPNGRSLVLEKLPAGDAAGFAGVQDRIDHHWRDLFGMAALATVLGVGAELGQNDGDSDIVRALRTGASGTLNSVGQQAAGRGLSVPPTLTIRPGAPVRVIVTRDLILEPFHP